jgi:hypothetical protein
VYFIDANTGFVVGDYGTIIHTNDGGATWIPIASGTSYPLSSVSFLNANFGFAVGASGTIIHTSNGGLNWNVQLSSRRNWLYDVTIINENIATVVGEDGLILRTTNGGVSWDVQPIGTTNHLYAVSFINANIGLSVGSGGTILRTNTGGVVSIDDKQIFTINPLDFILLQNYPNPFNPVTIISWQTPVGSHHKLKVYDILGNEVATLVDEYKEAGEHRVEFDARNLASGVYIYILKAGEFVSSKKMAVIK